MVLSFWPSLSLSLSLTRIQNTLLQLSFHITDSESHIDISVRSVVHHSFRMKWFQELVFLLFCFIWNSVAQLSILIQWRKKSAIQETACFKRMIYDLLSTCNFIHYGRRLSFSCKTWIFHWMRIEKKRRKKEK